MAQRTIAPTPEVEDNAAEAVSECRHHWVIQPADGPVSNGVCQICGEIREFKNYVESATWGDSRIASKNASATVESTSDDEDDRSTDGERESADEEAEAEV
jgi:hypothetical protein